MRKLGHKIQKKVARGPFGVSKCSRVGRLPSSGWATSSQRARVDAMCGQSTRRQLTTSATAHIRPPASPLADFELERYFARWEFTVPNGLLSSSDPEPLSCKELLAFARPEHKAMYDDLTLGYTESRGHPQLLQAIADMHGSLITAKDVVEVVPEEGIYLAMSCLLREGDHVVVSSPGYQSLNQIALSLRCRVSFWDVNPPVAEHNSRGDDRGNATADSGFDVEALEALVTPETRLIVVNTPHNPTGAHMTVAQQRDIVDMAQKHGCYLFFDEMYRYLEHSDSDRLPSVCELYDRGISLCGLSKSWGLPGLRTGWLCTQDEQLMKSVCSMKDFTTICSPAPAEILALIAVTARKEITSLHKTRIVDHSVPALRNFLSRHSGQVHCHVPRAGTQCFPQLDSSLLGSNGQWQNARMFCESFIADKGIMLLPGDVYGAQYGTNFRLGLGRKDFPMLLQQLSDFIQTNR